MPENNPQTEEDVVDMDEKSKSDEVIEEIEIEEEEESNEES